MQYILKYEIDYHNYKAERWVQWECTTIVTYESDEDKNNDCNNDYKLLKEEILSRIPESICRRKSDNTELIVRILDVQELDCEPFSIKSYT